LIWTGGAAAPVAGVLAFLAPVRRVRKLVRPHPAAYNPGRLRARSFTSGTAHSNADTAIDERDPSTKPWPATASARPAPSKSPCAGCCSANATRTTSCRRSYSTAHATSPSPGSASSKPLVACRPTAPATASATPSPSAATTAPCWLRG